MIMTGGDLGLFQFLADNTKVEWSGQFNGGQSAAGSSPCVITTTNSKNTCVSAVDDQTYNTFVHSHPHVDGKDKTYDDNKSDADEKFYMETHYENYGIYQDGKWKYPDEWN